MAIDRALDLLPASPERDRAREALVEDDGVTLESVWPRFSSMQYVADISGMSPIDLARETGMDTEAALWLLEHLNSSEKKAA